MRCGRTRHERNDWLFGHERGAFTGAIGTHHGVFEQAAGGTLLLDEVELLPLPAQATLLRVLETGDLRRVGGEQSLRADARVIAAANLDLERMVAEGSFRRDLYYRLKGIRIDVPRCASGARTSRSWSTTSSRSSASATASTSSRCGPGPGRR